jgi:hypothetical protein
MSVELLDGIYGALNPEKLKFDFSSTFHLTRQGTPGRFDLVMMPEK